MLITLRFAGRVLFAALLQSTLAAHAQGDPARAFDAANAAIRKPGTTVRIALIGDSTQTDNAGYGRGFCANFTAQVDCLNQAKGGASTRTYREQGLWDRALAAKPDYMVIQFGHNDLVTKEHMDRQVPMPDYVANLHRFIDEARAAHITPVLVTPLTRRYFEADGKVHSDLLEYSAAMRSVAHDTHTSLLDLQAESIAYLNKIGEGEGTKLGITKKDTDGKIIPDKTHLDWAGSYVFGRMVAADLGKAVPAVAKYVLATPAKLPPAGEKAMQVINGAPVTIILIGDSTTAPQGGWGPGFCADLTPNVKCLDDALNGRSTKSFRDEGHWDAALAEHGDYYLIQFGHNDQKLNSPKVAADPTQFAENLRRMIREVQAQNAIPVLITPLSRRTFVDGKVKEDLREYADVTRKVAAEFGLTCIDLNGMSTRFLNTLGQEKADEFNASSHADAKAENDNKPQPALDRTHLNEKGKIVFGRMVADTLIRTQVELGPDVKGLPTAQSVSPRQPSVPIVAK